MPAAIVAAYQENIRRGVAACVLQPDRFHAERIVGHRQHLRVLQHRNQLRAGALLRRLRVGRPCPYDYCWRSWMSATQMPATIVRLTLRDLVKVGGD